MLTSRYLCIVLAMFVLSLAIVDFRAEAQGPRDFSVVPADGSVQRPGVVRLRLDLSDERKRGGPVTFFTRQLRQSPSERFTIIALPDTQFYAKQHPWQFTAQFNWIRDNRDRLNIAFVTHLGDLVNDADDVQQWVRADRALRIIEGPLAIPYGIAVGNHDQHPRRNVAGTQQFNHYFPPTRYAGFPWYGGHFGEDNDNHFELFRAGGMDFVILHLEYDDHADPAVLAWADGVLKRFADRHAIVTSHFLLSRNEAGTFGAQGKAIYDALKHNRNLFLMLCGHITLEARRSDFDNGHVVHTLLADYQNRPDGGEGWLRILEFDPRAQLIKVSTYSPTLQKYERDADSEFVLEYDMSGVGPFAPLASLPPTGDEPIEADWPVPQRGAVGEWYATLGQDGSEVKTPVWHFSTAGHAADLDGDGDVDRQDAAFMLECQSGKYRVQTDPACGAARLDGDGDVDGRDYELLLRCYSGEGHAPVFDCMEPTVNPFGLATK